MPPSAMIVTPEAPVTAVKRADTQTVEMAIPPGSQPVHALTRRTSLWAAPPAARMEPARANNGILGSTGCVKVR